MGSPTVPNTFKLLKSCPSTGPNPKLINDLIAVGAVYKILTLNLSMISQNLPASGKVGMPSNIKEVPPALKGAYTI